MKQRAIRGFTLLPLVMILLGLVLLLLTGLEQRRHVASLACQRQRFHLKERHQSISALTVAPYLVWQPATLQWQCHQIEGRQLCLKQRSTCPEMALLRVSGIHPTVSDMGTLYRFVRQNMTRDPANALISPAHPAVSLFWVTNGWLDACPEKQPELCR